MAWRPASLKNLENNNGWISILSEADLPKDDKVAFFTKRQDSDEIAIEFYSQGCFTQYYKSPVTHYQSIIKPNLPLY